MSTIIPTLTDGDILESLSSLQKNFFEAILEGPSATSTFASRFASLGEITTKRARSHSHASFDPIMAPALTAAMTISAVASSLHEVTKFADELSVGLHSDLAGLFDNLSLNSDAKSENSLELPYAIPASRRTLSSGRRTEIISPLAGPAVDPSPATYQSRAYRWLRKNLHNPYPSAETKLRIAEKYCVTPKVISEWFAQARRRIGWSAILKAHFNGNRQLCIDCAYDIYVADADQAIYSSEVVKDFNDMKRKLGQLCEGRNESSTLASLSTKIRQSEVKRSKSSMGRKRTRDVDDAEVEECSSVFSRRSRKRVRYVICSSSMLLLFDIPYFRQYDSPTLLPMSRSTSFSTSSS